MIANGSSSSSSGSSNSEEILIAGIGNILMGDDGFGVEVVRRLALSPIAKVHNARIVDFGIRGFDLAFALSRAPRAAILIDAAQRGKMAGAVTVLEPRDLSSSQILETHGMHPLRAIDLARTLGGLPRVIRVVVCEPSVLGTEEDPIMGLSPEVERAIPQAIAFIETLTRAFAEEERELTAQ